MVLTNSISDWTNQFAATLEQEQDDLARKVMRRDESDWIVLERGASGVNTIFDGWRSIKARVHGVVFSGEHQPSIEREP